MSYINQLHLTVAGTDDTQRSKNDIELILLFANDLGKCSNESTNVAVPHYTAVFLELKNASTALVSSNAIKKCMYMLCAWFVHGAMTGKIRNYTKNQLMTMVTTFFSLHSYESSPPLDGTGRTETTEFQTITSELHNFYTLGDEAVFGILIGNQAYDNYPSTEVLNVPERQESADVVGIRLARVNFEKYKKNRPQFTYLACKSEVEAILMASERPEDVILDRTKAWVMTQTTAQSTLILGRVIRDYDFMEAYNQILSYIS